MPEPFSYTACFAGVTDERHRFSKAEKYGVASIL